MSDRDRNRWLQDVRDRQRNIVFPDTASNEARFWRNAMDGKTRLGKVQIIGIALMYLMLGALLWSMIRDKLHYPCAAGPLFDRLICAFSGWAELLAFFGLLFLILRWRVRRALRTIEDAERSRRQQ